MKHRNNMSTTDLYTQYPKLFRQVGLPASESCMHWGMTIGDGWVPLISDLSKCLTSYDGVEYAQIKEKFGQLRIYLDFDVDVTDETKKLCLAYVNTYAKYSLEKCEVCGEVGTRDTTNGWYSTLCPTHRKEKGGTDVNE